MIEPKIIETFILHRKNHQVYSWWCLGEEEFESVLHLFQFTAYITVHITFLDGCTFVMKLFASTEGHLDLDQITLQVDGGRDQGESFFINLSLQSFDFALMSKKPTISIRLMVMDAPMRIGLNGKSNKIQPSISNCHIAVTKAESAVPQGFYLGSGQGDSTFQVLDDLIVEICFLIFLKWFEGILILFHLIVPSYTETDEISAGIGFYYTDSSG